MKKIAFKALFLIVLFGFTSYKSQSRLPEKLPKGNREENLFR